jgi:hypothetical protein
MFYSDYQVKSSRSMTVAILKVGHFETPIFQYTTLLIYI